MIPTGLLPEGTIWCVAGGWAACPALATDQDLWVLVDEGVEVADERARLLDHLRTYFGDDYAERVVELADARTSDAINAYGGSTTVPIVKVASLYLAGGERHLMVARADVDTLLSSFDVSTHQVALLPDGRVVVGAGYTGPHMPPEQLRDTPSTPARMAKIAERFGHPVVAQTLAEVA